MSVIDKDLGYKVILGRLEHLQGTVKVGFFSDSGEEPNGVTVAEVATYNEYGTGRIPARPFMRQTVDAKQGDWANLAQNVEKRVVGGMGIHQGLELIGIKAKGDTQEMIDKGDFAPNAPATIRRKKSSHPLIDTGRMRASVSFKVEE